MRRGGRCSHSAVGCGLVKGKAIPDKKMRHLFLYFDNRFAHDLPLLFHAANTMLRHAVNRSVGARVKSSKSTFADFFETVNNPEFAAMLDEAKREPKGASTRQVTKTATTSVAADSWRVGGFCL